MNSKKHARTLVDRADCLKRGIIENGLGRESDIKGCTESEILELENKYDIVLPLSYKVFLKNFGHGLGGTIMKDCDILYKDVFLLTDIVKNEILIEEGDPTLPEKAFVYSGRYNEQFLFFNADGLVEEPETYYYMIDDTEFKKIGNSVFDTLERSFKGALDLKLRKDRKR